MKCSMPFFVQFTKSLFRIAGHDQYSQIFQIFLWLPRAAARYSSSELQRTTMSALFSVAGFQSCLHLVKAWMVNDLESCTGEKAACKGCPCFSPDRIAIGEQKYDRPFGMLFSVLILSFSKATAPRYIVSGSMIWPVCFPSGGMPFQYPYLRGMIPLD